MPSTSRAISHRPSSPPDRASAEVPTRLLAALEEALRLGDAEIAIETPMGHAAIYVAHGALAWVALSYGTERLSDVLERYGIATRATLRATFRECQRHRLNFAEALVARGADRMAVRRALLEHNAIQFATLVDSKPVALRVAPRARDYASDLVFSLDEVLSTTRAAPRSAQSTDTRPAPATDATPGHAATATPAPTERYDMADITQSLDDVMKIDGAIASALVDWESGLTLGTVGSPGFDIEYAASGNTAVVKAKMNVMRHLGIRGPIEDILITLANQYHLIRPLAQHPSLYLYVAIDKDKGNLGLARHRLKTIEESLSV